MRILSAIKPERKKSHMHGSFFFLHDFLLDLSKVVKAKNIHCHRWRSVINPVHAGVSRKTNMETREFSGKHITSVDLR